MKSKAYVLKREFDPPLRNKNRPLNQRLSGIININCVRTVSSYKLHNYTEPRLVKGKRWYIDFRYKVPAELRPEYGEWHRFRINHRINKYKDDTYANEILEALKYSLDKGFNPFTDEQKEFGLNGSPKEMTVKEAMNFFLEKQKGRGLEADTLRRYEGVVRMLLNYFGTMKLLGQPVKSIRKQHIQQFLEYHKELHRWSNRQYNNIKGYSSIIFSFLHKSDTVDKNPVAFIENLKTKSTKHKFFSKELFSKLITVLKTNDPYLLYAVKFIYYLGCRSGKELRLLKVGDIMDGSYFKFRPEISKSDREDIIPIDKNLRVTMKEMNLFTSDPSLYIFGIKYKPGIKPVPIHYFSKRFAVIRELCGLSNEYSLYSFRHTRCVDLLRAGAKLSDISKLFRHNSIITTSIYARNLGQDFNSKELERLTRKI